MTLAPTASPATASSPVLDLDSVDAIREEAREVDARALLDRPGEVDAHPAAQAIALLEDPSVSTSDIKAAAEDRVAGRTPALHTFVPVYTTNHCDSACKMCAMRKGNDRLVRKFAGKSMIEDQLSVLYEHQGVRGVGFLTGEYEDEYTRLSNAFRIGWAIRRAFDMGFERVYFNIGSLTRREVEVLADWVDPEEPVTMCVFQETYDRDTYARFMGSDPSLPKADFDRRIQSFENWLDAGFRYVNPGVLVGLHDDVAEELSNLISHVSHLADRGAVVDVSLPRLRPAHGSKNVSGVDDDRYLRMMASVAYVCPDQRLVLTTREEEEFQEEAVDLCGVFSPGSPDVAPYRREGMNTNEDDSSQFSVPDLRPPGQVLAELERGGRDIDHFTGLSAGSAH